MPVVSVIIPTYGMPFYLDRTISSVLNQTFADFEIFVVDDNNPDTEARKETKEIIYSIKDERLHYLKHDKNLNGSAARNTGIAQASGKYLAFLDSDDEYMPERLEKCVSVMENADRTVAGVYTGCEFRKNGETYKTMKTVKEGRFLVETLACTFKLGTGSNLFVRNSVVNEINGFDETFLRHQDYEFLVRVFEKYSLASISEVLVIKNNDNINLPAVEKIIEIKKQYLNKYEPLIQKCSEKEKEYIFHNQYMQIAEAAQRTKKYSLANQFYKRAKSQGGLTIKEQMRRAGLWVRNLIFQ